MCGIIFETSSRRNVNESISEIYEEQKHRGEEGFGLVTINSKREYNLSRCEIEPIFIHKLFNKDSKTILVHHRTPTSTNNEREQTHPMVIDDERLKYEYLIVHNGIIYNKEDCRTKFEKDGWEFKTAVDEKKFNDSEAFAIDLAMHIEGKWKDWTARGSIAFVALQVERATQKVEKVLFGRNTNPLNLYFAKSKKVITNLIVSSEGPGEEIEEKMLYSLDLETMKLKMTKFDIGLEYEYPSKYRNMYEDKYDDDGTVFGFHSCRRQNERKLLEGDDKKTTIVLEKTSPGYGNKVVITDKTAMEENPRELTEEEIEKIEDAEEAIADELGIYIRDPKAFKLQEILEDVITFLSSFDKDKLYFRNKIMAKIARELLDLERFANELHESYKEISWETPVEEKDIEDEDDFNLNGKENETIKQHVRVH